MALLFFGWGGGGVSSQSKRGLFKTLYFKMSFILIYSLTSDLLLHLEISYMVF